MRARFVATALFVMLSSAAALAQPPPDEPAPPPDDPLADPLAPPVEPGAPPEPIEPPEPPEPVALPPQPVEPEAPPPPVAAEAGAGMGAAGPGAEGNGAEVDGAGADAKDGGEVGTNWTDYVRPGIDVIAQYNFSLREEAGATEWFHEFELPRAHLSLTGAYEGAEARVLAEAVRSASEGALIGVAGDSLVMRLRQAYAGYTAFEMLTIRGGVVPTLTVPALEEVWAMRAVERVALERTGLSSPADLGGTSSVTLPRGFGWVGVGSYNGEGYNNRELNRGKSFEAAARIHPLAFIQAMKPLSIFGSYVSGSTGTGLVRANRLTGSLSWDMERVGGGGSVTWAQGVGDVGGQDALVIEGFVRGEPYPKVLLAGQVANFWRNLDAPETDSVLTITGAAGYRIVPPLEALLAVDAFAPTDLAAAALPELDDLNIRAIARARFD